MGKLPTIILCCALSGGLQYASAEVITIPIGQQGGDLKTLPRPTRGMRSSAVMAQFGEPMSMEKARGEPPISQWHYENFTVYFEHDTVIHSVLRHAPKHPVPE